MNLEYLNGVWHYRVGKGADTDITVPFSRLCVGHSECERWFDLTQHSEKVLLRFEGITYYAKVTLNGAVIGEMLPYCEYTFDVTTFVVEKGNHLLVELEDISPTFGPSEGWENYGGIIRDVSLIYTSKTYIKDVFFHSDIQAKDQAALYTLEMLTEGEAEGILRVSLSFEGTVKDKFEVKTSETQIKRSLEKVCLWSPDHPWLYQLTVELVVDETVVDTYVCNVGFREFRCNRHRFLLNGEEIFLQGVCKHEMIGDYGHTVPPEEIEKDLKKIKESGCNFVRLVHYPHCKQTLEIADRLGLMVSEEPGLWWSDTSDPDIHQGSLEVLKRTVLRDRNHASIVFWLCFNECEFTEQFLLDSAAVCRQYDPTRLVSGANCMSNEDTLQYYNICGFDFYTMHPYAPTFDRALESAQILYDKPLLFTEWGGYFVYDNPHLITDFIHGMYDLYLANDDSGALAGAIFWYWSEVRDFGRGRPACIDGVLKEALMDVNGKPTMIYHAYCDAWKNAKKQTDEFNTYTYTAFDDVAGKTAFCCSSPTDEPRVLACAQMCRNLKAKSMRRRKVVNGPILARQEVAGMSGVPFLLSDGDVLLFEGAGESTSVTVLGAVGASKGYPISGTYGETVAEITVEYVDGTSDRFMMRNGMELTIASTIIGSSRIVPQAEHLTQFAAFGYDKNFENYIINRLELTLPERRPIKAVTFSSANHGYDVLIYGVLI